MSSWKLVTLPCIYTYNTERARSRRVQSQTAAAAAAAASGHHRWQTDAWPGGARPVQPHDEHIGLGRRQHRFAGAGHGGGRMQVERQAGAHLVLVHKLIGAHGLGDGVAGRHELQLMRLAKGVAEICVVGDDERRARNKRDRKWIRIRVRVCWVTVSVCVHDDGRVGIWLRKVPLSRDTFSAFALAWRRGLLQADADAQLAHRS